MLLLKFHNKKGERTESFNRSISNIANYISNTLNFAKTKLTTDSNSVEIISGNTNIYDDEQIVTELIVKKVIAIKKSELNDKDKLDQYLHEIKNFCSHAKEIENLDYLPLHLRQRK
jgi:hypothetical protein